MWEGKDGIERGEWKGRKCCSMHVEISVQESWATAKMTTRCALYMGALKIFESPWYWYCVFSLISMQNSKITPYFLRMSTIIWINVRFRAKTIIAKRWRPLPCTAAASEGMRAQCAPSWESVARCAMPGCWTAWSIKADEYDVVWLERRRQLVRHRLHVVHTQNNVTNERY